MPSHFEKFKGDSSRSATAAQLIDQSIREQCVFEQIDSDKKSHWFEYIHQLINKCILTQNSGKVGNPRNFEFESIVPITSACHD